MTTKTKNLAPAIFLLIASLTIPLTAVAARKPSVYSWVEHDLTPFVIEQLATHPRFKGQLVRFVVFEDGNPAPRSNELALSLRDLLADAVINAPGVRVGWLNTSSDKPRSQDPIDCTRDTVHYFIGLEISDAGNGNYKVDLRALDLEERSWVAGFSRSWKGSFSHTEYRTYRHVERDKSFLGQRTVPFRVTQPDLLAAYLAHELGCAILRQQSGEYRVTLGTNDKQSRSLDGLVELVSNNLSGQQVLKITADDDQANAVLKGKAHHIDNDLYQYWVIVAPADASSEMPTVSASAYVHLPNLNADSSDPQSQLRLTRVPPQNLVAHGNADVLAGMHIVELKQNRACTTGVSYAYLSRNGNRLQSQDDHCFAMQVMTSQDAVVFFLHHQRNHGLVRLSDNECRQSAEARIARANETVDYALPLLSLTRDALSPATAWHVDPEADTYYAIAVSDTKAARALSKHLAQLPRRCTVSVRAGLKGARLENWLAEFSKTITQWQPYVDWQAIHVKNVY
jgi:hypothetical protein